MYGDQSIKYLVRTHVSTEDHLRSRAEERVLKIGWGGVHEYERACLPAPPANMASIGLSDIDQGMFVSSIFTKHGLFIHDLSLIPSLSLAICNSHQMSFICFPRPIHQSIYQRSMFNQFLE